MRAHSENIFRFKALLILVVFGISLLPRQVLHNFVTNHKHTKYAGYPGKAQLSAETFNCSTDTIFLQQTYHITASWQPETKADAVAIVSTHLVDKIQIRSVLLPALRGPPSVAYHHS